MQIQIKITPEESLALEKVHYELNARKGLLSYIMTTMPKDNTFFQKYHDEYLSLYKYYEQLKSEISQKYVIPISSGKLINWELNFDNCELTIIDSL